jgi:Uma2 family endonuclease
MQLSPDEYLKGAYKDWPGDWEGDFDYLDGTLDRHDWGDYSHSTVDTQLVAWFAKYLREWHIRVLRSITLEITPTRFRVPDLVIFDRDTNAENFVRTSVPLVVIEVLSPEDTMMHVTDLEADYRKMGVENIWIIDPRQKTGWKCEREGWRRTELFLVPFTPISLNLAAALAADL